jgi:hypothetical protein
MQKLLTADEAAPYLGVAAGTLANWRVRGLGPKFLKVSSRVMYDPDDIAAWRNARRASSTSESIAA